MFEYIAKKIAAKLDPEIAKQQEMEEQANKTVTKYVLLSMGAGAVPVPERAPGQREAGGGQHRSRRPEEQCQHRALRARRAQAAWQTSAPPGSTAAGPPWRLRPRKGEGLRPVKVTALLTRPRWTTRWRGGSAAGVLMGWVGRNRGQAV